MKSKTKDTITDLYNIKTETPYENIDITKNGLIKKRN